NSQTETANRKQPTENSQTETAKQKTAKQKTAKQKKACLATGFLLIPIFSD
ncbi:hypothetical protein HKO50_10600, partial [Neisseria meningitidis]|nr:hypothetical protein [Neisseria meningitidis]